MFNLVGFGLLLNVGAIAVLSSPFPFRVFMNEPAVLLVFNFPYGWILPMCVSSGAGRPRADLPLAVAYSRRSLAP